MKPRRSSATLRDSQCSMCSPAASAMPFLAMRILTWPSWTAAMMSATGSLATTEYLTATGPCRTQTTVGVAVSADYPRTGWPE